MPGPTVVLVHGAFADASGFAGVIRELESAGHRPVHARLLQALADDRLVPGLDGPGAANMSRDRRPARGSSPRGSPATTAT